VAVEIVEEVPPVGRQQVNLEVAQREREGVVDADQRRRILGEPFHQPFGDAPARPVFVQARRRLDFHRARIAFGQIDAQALKAGVSAPE
jgi:hypothetical protein